MCECVRVCLSHCAYLLQYSILQTQQSLPRLVLCARALKLNVVISRHLYTAQDSPNAHTHADAQNYTYLHVAHNHGAVDSQQSATLMEFGLAEFVFGCKHKKITEKEMNAGQIIQWHETHTNTHTHTRIQMAASNTKQLGTHGHES